MGGPPSFNFYRGWDNLVDPDTITMLLIARLPCAIPVAKTAFPATARIVRLDNPRGTGAAVRWPTPHAAAPPTRVAPPVAE